MCSLFARTQQWKLKHRRHFHQKQDVSLIAVVGKSSRYFNKSVLNILDIELSCKLDACKLTKLAGMFLLHKLATVSQVYVPSVRYWNCQKKNFLKKRFLPAVATIDDSSSFIRMSFIVWFDWYRNSYQSIIIIIIIIIIITFIYIALNQ